MPGITIQDILSEKEAGLDLELLAGEKGLLRHVQVPRIQKPGLALAGYVTNLHPDRLQVLGSTELSYLNHLPVDLAEKNLAKLCNVDICCFIITKGQEPPSMLVREVEARGIPLLRTHHQSSTFISLITQFLEERLLPSTTIHGVLVDVLGVGVLLHGKSGIGKSEVALDLVLRGHRLVADDVVKVRMKLPAVLFGEGMDLLHYHMEIRGLGIINIKHLFGVAAIRERKKIDLAIELVSWEDGHEYDRLGLEEEKYKVLGLGIPLLKIPVRPGRNITSIVEVAARNQLLKEMGYNSAVEFQDRLEKRMAETAWLHSHTIIGDNLE
ncbi:HPr(Ser) kinase/phosphatase [Geothermobacter hydrogeniphilus]|uniref:HPr kinase/phosphorylase n=1 Tax=Geothermobacter hydrogeniphilus TaxID=1969733 RepID=A0A1X0Y309_9BACT|nr:HPr(Ser) kinase/phosphatase [Geothermobacter hydrogeniphilus]ORJ59543.1 HPr(Ser) kinase/phosphatase [Geothermobacter hydrogeniphilus]PNU19767.1 HPr(Ser) kinase/phosphatase [Geothermobacter hydrogeniphilus]